MSTRTRSQIIKREENITFRDVSLVEGKSVVSSRSEIDLSVELPKGKKLNLPVMTASMDTITSEQMAKKFLDMGGAIVHHRYSSVQKRSNLIYLGAQNRTSDLGLNGTAVGYNDSRKDVQKLIESGADLISLDLAHAWHEQTADWILEKEDLFQDVLLMVGNFSHVNGMIWLRNKVGDLVDIVKVSQGGGSACTTRQKAGIGKPTLQAVIDYTVDIRAPDYEIVADGGIRHPGDIAKSLGAGACAGMIGGMISGTKECPGDIVEEDGKKMKKYRGMASSDAKQDGNVSTNHVEGVSTYVEYKGSVQNILDDIRDGLKSSIATCGFQDVESFRRNAEFIRLSRGSQVESTPHQLSNS